MAKTLSKTGIITGQDILAKHVTQSIDALTGIDAYDITISGSLSLPGTTASGSFIGDGSGLTGVTGEWDGSHNGNASITGSLTVTSDISSSGNITAYDITSSHAFHIVADNHTEFTISGSNSSATFNLTNQNSAGAIIINTAGVGSIFFGTGGNTSDIRMYPGGHLWLTGAAAKQNVSASGDLYGDNLIVATDITASGNISASGDIIAKEWHSTDDIATSGNRIAMGVDNRIDLAPNNIIVLRLEDDLVTLNKDTKVVGNITASSDISASGTVYVENIIQGSGESKPTTFHGAEYVSVAIGNNCYPNPTAGSYYNVALGRNALSKATTAAQSCAIGDSSLQNVTAGNYNNALGFGCLNGIETGSYNVAIGHQTLFYNHNIIGNIAIGYRAMFGNDNNDECTYNTILGYHAGYNVGSGSKNVMIGYQCVNDSNWESSNTVYVGASCVPSAVAGIDNENVFGYATTGRGTNTVALGNTSITSIEGQVVPTTYSDSRIKRNIQSGSLGLDFINKLNPVRFQRVNPSEYPEEIIEKRYTERTKWDPETSSSIIIPADPSPPTDNSWVDGLIAQEVSASLNGIPSDIWNENEIDGKQGIKYSILTIPLIKAVQELSAKVTALEAQISGSL